MELDLNQKGLALVFKDYQEEAMKLLWGDVKYLGSRRENEKGAFSSREMCDHINEAIKTRLSISRASVINFLNAMVDEGILNCHETTGRGGYRHVYYAKLTRDQFWGRVTILAINRLEEASGLSSTVLTSVVIA